MNQPLGKAIGNWFEMKESVQGLQGNGPADLMDVTFALGAEILSMAQPGLSIEDAIAMQQKTIADGSAFEKLLKIVELQEGDPDVLIDMEAYPKAAYRGVILAERSGFLSEIDTMGLGFAGIQLGAGRRVISDEIDYSSGMYIHKRIGDRVETGQEVLTLYSNNEKALNETIDQLANAFTYSESEPEIPTLIVEKIE